MKIKFKFKKHSESKIFSTGYIFLLPVPFFTYMNFGKIKGLCFGFLFIKHEYSIVIRNKLKLTKQTQTKAG